MALRAEEARAAAAVQEDARRTAWEGTVAAAVEARGRGDGSEEGTGPGGTSARGGVVVAAGRTHLEQRRGSCPPAEGNAGAAAAAAGAAGFPRACPVWGPAHAY